MQRTLFSSTGLKCIAILAMVIDHIGAELYPEILLLRIIGRLTLPIMAFFIAIGYEKTSNIKRYISRMIFWGIISILPYAYYFQSKYQNILFTLAIGLSLLWALDKVQSKDIKYIILLIVCLLVTVFQFDGFFLAICMILIFRYYRSNPIKLTISFTILLAIYQILLLYLSPNWNNPQLWIQNASILALPLLSRYNGNQGHLKFSFYAFYPLHLLILLTIKHLFF